MPHSTQVAGYAAIHGGDDRYIGNIFLGGDPALAYGPTVTRPGERAGYGTAGYDGHPASLEDYLALVADPTRGDHERFKDVKQPVFIRDNVYAAGAKAIRGRAGGDRPRRQRRHRRRSSTKAPRSTWSATCRPISTTSASAPSAEPTSNASASSTPTSRNPTAPRSSWPPTWSGPTRPDRLLPARPDHRPRLGQPRIRVW